MYIDIALLDRLQKADPGLWEDIYQAGFNHCDWPDYLIQGKLQDTIRGRKLYFTMVQTSPGPNGQEYRVSIRYKRNYVEGEVRLFGEDPWPQLAECDGNSPAEALLRAYLAAIECV